MESANKIMSVNNQSQIKAKNTVAAIKTAETSTEIKQQLASALWREPAVLPRKLEVNSSPQAKFTPSKKKRVTAITFYI